MHGAHPHHHLDSERRVFWAMCLTAVFAVAELVGGLLSGSLALLADAAHMLTDTTALAFAWTAFRLGRRPPDRKRSYGYQRFQILAAFLNGTALVVVVAWILFEALERLREPIEIQGGLMLVVAALGLLVNIVALALLHGGERNNLNLRGAALHVFGDLLGSLATMLAAAVIIFSGWTPIDPILSVLVGLLILRSAWLLVWRSAHILLEGTPKGIDVAELRNTVAAAVADVKDIHHVHAWSLTPDQPLVTLHAHVHSEADHESVLEGIHRCLAERFGIAHATIQIEYGRCLDDLPLGGPEHDCRAIPANEP